MPAGGQGTRFGGETPKQLLHIAGKPVLAWTLERLLSSGLTGVTVALPADRLAEATEIFLRLIRGDVLNSDDVRETVLTRADFRSDEDWERVRSTARDLGRDGEVIAIPSTRTRVWAAVAPATSMLCVPVDNSSNPLSRAIRKNSASKCSLTYPMT